MAANYSNNNSKKTCTSQISFSSSLDSVEYGSTAQFYHFQRDGLFFKYAKKINFYLEHEVEIAKILNTCQHLNVVKFLRTEEISSTDVEFEALNHLNIKHVVCSVWELLKGELFIDFIKSNHKDRLIINLCVQVLLTILELQDKYKFVHGDLHTDNVYVVDSGDYKRDFEYIIGGKKYTLANMGYIAKIFDFGNSMCFRKKNFYMSAPLFAYAEGVSNFEYDNTQDLLCFLDASFFEFKRSRKNFNVLDFMNLFENLSSPFLIFEGRRIIDDDEENFNQSLKEMFDIDDFDLLWPDCIYPCIKIDTLFNSQDIVEDDLPMIEEIFKKFLAVWKEIARYFTKTEQEVVFKEMCLFFRENNEQDDTCENSTTEIVEGKFNMLIHSQFQKFNTVNNIDLQHTSKLLHYFFIVVENCKSIICFEHEPYSKRLAIENKLFKEMVKAHGKETDSCEHILACLFQTWFKNSKNY